MFTDLSAGGIFVVFISLVISITVHEAMHGYVAHWLGDDTAADAGRLTLNPLKSIDLVTTIIVPLLLIIAHYPPFFAAKPVPFNPSRVRFQEYGAALVGAAGPISNFLLAVVGAIVFRTVGSHLSASYLNDLIEFVEINIALFIFNLIPFPPLDGSRVLYAFAPEPLQEIMQRIESAGFLAIFVFIILIFRFIAGPIDTLEVHIINILLGT